MDQRRKDPLPTPHSRWLAPLVAVVVLALLLAWWRPWQADTAPQPAPHATATLPGAVPTRAPERIALPTALPRRDATATPLVAGNQARATPATPAVAAAGHLLYLGTLAGRKGVIAANADGGDQRLLAEGAYSELAWSPDGSRFAAAGPIPSGGSAYQVAIFAPDGRVLARYPFPRHLSGPIRWSPSGKFLLCFALPGNAVPPTQPLETWVIGDDGLRPIAAPPGAISYPYGWTPDERIAFLAMDTPSQPASVILWTTDATGNDPRQVYSGRFSPIAWSPDGFLVYTVISTATAGPNAAPNQVIAIESSTNIVRYFVNADELAAAALGVPFARDTYRFAYASLAPAGTRLALIVFRGAGLGTPITRAAANTGALVIMRPGDQLGGVPPLGIAPLTASGGLGPVAWSPDGTHLALFVFGDQPGEDQLRIFDLTGATIVAYRASTAAAAGPPQVAWSADGNWIAYTRPDGLAVAAIGSTRSAIIAPDGSAPGWRPTRRP